MSDKNENPIVEGEGELLGDNDSLDSAERLLKEEIDGGYDPKDLQE